MLKGLLAGLTPRNTILTIVLVSNALVWYYCADDIIISIAPAMEDNFLAGLQIWTASFAALIGAALLGARLSSRIANKAKFLSLWMTSGILLPFATLLINPDSVFSATLLAIGFGVSLGIGLPSCMEYFSKSNPVETRGRSAGMIMLCTGASIIALGILTGSSLYAQVTALAAWRAFGLLIFVTLKPSKTINIESRTPSYKDVISNRPFILYFAPWIMFSLVNYLSTPALDSITTMEMQDALSLVQNALIGVSAIVAGFLADIVGRKPIAIAGFASLGLGYAVLGLAPTNALAFFFHAFVNGIAWGALLVIFVITIWGELSRSAHSEKFYAIGVAPFFVSRFLSFALGEKIMTILPSGNLDAVFSFSSFFLFLGILPLVLAAETLPEKIKKTRELRIYVEKAQEIAQKYY